MRERAGSRVNAYKYKSMNTHTHLTSHHHTSEVSVYYAHAHNKADITHAYTHVHTRHTRLRCDKVRLDRQISLCVVSKFWFFHGWTAV